MTWQLVTTFPQPPRRPVDGHKGSFGRVLIVAGSAGMSGAAILSGLGALRGGAGLVSLAVPFSLLPIVAAAEPSYLTIPLNEEQGRLAASASGQIETALHGKNAAAIGPGLGISAGICSLVTALYEQVPLPLVVDADALNALALTGVPLNKHAGPRILTPHPGEFSRLTGESIATISENREEMAVRFAAAHDVVLVLKGRESIVTDGRRLSRNQTGNSGMGTGGTGDVLTGLIAALLAQGLEPFAAARFGVHLHGLAGDLAAEEFSEPGLIASDVARFLGRAWKSLLPAAGRPSRS